MTQNDQYILFSGFMVLALFTALALGKLVGLVGLAVDNWLTRRRERKQGGGR